MSNQIKSLGRNRDWPQLESAQITSASAGTGSDPAQDTVLFVLPDLRLSFLPGNLNQGLASALPNNRSVLRQFGFTSTGASNTTGGATNYFDFRLNVWRNGVLQGCLGYYTLGVSTTLGTVVNGTGVATSSSTAITGGSTTTFTVASANNIVVGTVLAFAGTGSDAGKTDSVTVSVVSGTSITVSVAPVNSYVNTILISAAPSAGTISTVTPAAMTNIVAGMQLGIGSGATFEVVTVSSASATTFTAAFVFAHATSETVAAVLVPFKQIVLVPALNASAATSKTTIVAGTQTVVPASIYGIHVGDILSVAGGVTAEGGLTATTVSGTSLTATFTQAHSGTYNVGYYVATTSSTAVTAGTTTAIVVASAANIVAGNTVILQGTGADSAKTNTMTVQTVVGTTVTFTAAIATNSYSNTINVTNLAYTSATTTTVAGKKSQTITVVSTTGIANGSLVLLQDLVSNTSTNGFTGTPEVVTIESFVSNTSITVSPANVHTNAFAVLPFTATTSTTAVAAAGTATITLASGTNFASGLTNTYVWGGSAVAPTENVKVLTVTNYAFTALFAQGHNGSYTLTTTANQQSSNYFGINEPFEVIGGDVVTFNRISSNATGLASPAGLVQSELVPSMIKA